MTSISLSVNPRNTEEKAVDLRKTGVIPGVVYGFQTENQPIECEYQAFHKTYVQAGESTVIDLEVGGKSIPVLIHQLDLDPVSGKYAHVDFFAVDMKKKVTANIPLHIIGESSAVKNLAGVLIHNKDTISVSCLPKDLPQSFTADLGMLDELGKSILVSDISIPDAVEVQEQPDEPLLTVQAPRKAEEEKPAEEGAEEEGGEEEEKKEGEEKAEGEKNES
jgi:large subunit ribosomal protein L25